MDAENTDEPGQSWEYAAWHDKHLEFFHERIASLTLKRGRYVVAFLGCVVLIWLSIHRFSVYQPGPSYSATGIWISSGLGPNYLNLAGIGDWFCSILGAFAVMFLVVRLVGQRATKNLHRACEVPFEYRFFDSGLELRTPDLRERIYAGNVLRVLLDSLGAIILLRSGQFIVLPRQHLQIRDLAVLTDGDASQIESLEQKDGNRFGRVPLAQTRMGCSGYYFPIVGALVCLVVVTIVSPPYLFRMISSVPYLEERIPAFAWGPYNPEIAEHGAEELPESVDFLRYGSSGIYHPSVPEGSPAKLYWPRFTEPRRVAYLNDLKDDLIFAREYTLYIDLRFARTEYRRFPILQLEGVKQIGKMHTYIATTPFGRGRLWLSVDDHAGLQSFWFRPFPGEFYLPTRQTGRVTTSGGESPQEPVQNAEEVHTPVESL